ncbi:MAG: hypothetical protein KDB82_18600 [Planctomycetes bacterium]|nr:hypothetical protein [Planctomycetota bacterium]
MQMKFNVARLATAGLFISVLLCGCGSKDRTNHSPENAPPPPAKDLVPAANEEILVKYLHSDTLRLLRSDCPFELYSLDKTKWVNWHRDEKHPGMLDKPSPDLFAEAMERLQDEKFVLGKTDLSHEQRSDFNSKLFVAIGNGTGPRDCFYPTYAVHMQDDGEEVVVLLCSLCGCIAVLEPAGGKVRRNPMPKFAEFLDFLDALLKEKGIATSR